MAGTLYQHILHASEVLGKTGMLTVGEPGGICFRFFEVESLQIFDGVDVGYYTVPITTVSDNLVVNSDLVEKIAVAFDGACQ